VLAPDNAAAALGAQEEPSAIPRYCDLSPRGGPSRALLVTAKDDALPPFLQRTNPRGAQRNILLVQGAIVTAISAVYLVMKDVSSAFFLISALVVGLYMMMFAAAIHLRRTQPDLPRQFRIPGGTASIWIVAGTGFLAVAFALVLAFVPPSQLPIGNPASYVALVAGGHHRLHRTPTPDLQTAPPRLAHSEMNQPTRPVGQAGSGTGDSRRAAGPRRPSMLWEFTISSTALAPDPSPARLTHPEPPNRGHGSAPVCARAQRAR